MKHNIYYAADVDGNIVQKASTQFLAIQHAIVARLPLVYKAVETEDDQVVSPTIVWMDKRQFLEWFSKLLVTVGDVLGVVVAEHRKVALPPTVVAEVEAAATALMKAMELLGAGYGTNGEQFREIYQSDVYKERP